jgi:soluble lytic murein transglycosylase-like protein
MTLLRRSALAALALLAAAPAAAEVYGRIDPDGAVHLSDRPTLGYALLVPAPGDIVSASAERHGVDPLLLRAVIAVESGNDPRAVSRKGAAGLMQLMPLTAARYGVADRFDPAQNVDAGARYLRSLIDRFDEDLSLALAAYNAGEAAVLRYGRRVPPYAETRGYVVRVRQVYDRLRR